MAQMTQIPLALPPRFDADMRWRTHAPVLYRPSDSLTLLRSGQTVAFTRASSNGPFAHADGAYRAPSSLIRSEMVDLDSDRTFDRMALRIDQGLTNHILRSDDLVNATWVKTGAGTVSTGTNCGDIPVNLVNDTDAVAIFTVTQAIGGSVFASGGSKGVAWYVGRHSTQPAAASRLRILETGTVDRGTFQWTFNTDGTLATFTAPSGGGTALGSEFVGVTNDGVLIYRLYGSWSSSFNQAVSNTIEFVASLTGTQTGASYMGAIAAYNSTRCGSYIRTLTTTLTSADDKWQIPFEVLPNYGAFTVFVDFIEMAFVGVNTHTILRITDDTGNNPSLILQSNGTNWQVQHHNGTSSVTSTSTTPPTFGQRVELMAEFRADGSVRLHQSINQGTLLSIAASAALALGTRWGTTSGQFLRSGPGTIKLLGASVLWGAPSIDTFRALF